ncbi:MAG: YCF48-related protein [Pseudomonadota bacterium]
MRRVALALAASLLAGHAIAQEAEVKPQAFTGPRAAMTAPKAAQARMLDIATAGSQLVAVGEQGVILRSADGKQWTQSPSPVNSMLTRVRFTDDKRGWVLGYSGSILQTEDGGATWKLRHYDQEQHAMYDILFLDAQHGFAVGGFGNVLETRDGGTTWAESAPALAEQRLHLNTILRTADGSILIAGEHGLLARSTDAGASWKALSSPYIGSYFGALAQGDKGAVVYGMRGNVFETADLAACPSEDIATWDPDKQVTVEDPAKIAALGWKKIENPSRESLFGTMQLKSSRVFFGINGTVLQQQNNEGALVPVKTPAVETLVHAVTFNNRVIAVGRQGIQDLGRLP